MSEPSGEWKESLLQLEQLIPVCKGTECEPEHAQDTSAELNDMTESRTDKRLGV
jgi:hypothetical protein